MPPKPLRPHDPRVLGGYELLGLLGEGGMGAVYLAQDRAGTRVAVKVVKPEFAEQPEFRGRFRSEVSRARQVPPFSTAAVLDADPDHATPYLVVEYVDGPDLAQVVAERGPLTGGALHSVAVGVATALVAIHGAGVIHRDLKPRNVLLAPGAPKVIDFGIARALESTSEHTRTGQLVGTLSYMAPERLDGKAVTPAVDVFAWGALVAYAATGRTPFVADTPTATAVRILTGEPELDGLTGQLRDLVSLALAKDPAARPTAQRLLDALLTGAPAVAEPAVPVATPGRPGTGTGPSNGGPAGTGPSNGGPTSGGAARTRRRAGVTGAVAVLAAAGIAAGWLFSDGDGDGNGGGTPADAAPSSAPSPSARATVIADPLTAPGLWREELAGSYSCEPGDLGLTISAEWMPEGDATCPGPATVFTGDLSVKVNVSYLSDDACAVVWFRYDGKSAGYQLVVTPAEVSVAVYEPDGNAGTLSSAQLKLDYSARHQFTLDMAGEIATVHADGDKVLTAVVDHPGLTEGAVALGLAQTDERETGYVRFTNVEVRGVTP